MSDDDNNDGFNTQYATTSREIPSANLNGAILSTKSPIAK